MPIPGFDVPLVDTPASRGAPTATDTLFLVDFAAQGPLFDPQEILSPDHADEVFGATQPAWSKMQDSLDAFFALGGARAYVVRAAGPAGTTGSDDHTNITPTDWGLALSALDPDKGPGQLVIPAAQTAALQGLAIDHGWTHNRIALLNPPSGSTDTQLEALATAAIATTGGRFASLWRDYATISGRVAGTTRTVPWTAIQAGLIAALDQATGNPGLEAAGKRGIAPIVQALVNELKDDTRRQTLRDAQVNTAKTKFGQVRAYGARTLADLTALPQWWNLGGSRTIMAARALIGAIDEDYAFEQVTPANLALYNGAIKGALRPLVKNGALWENPTVDTSEAVNTPATIAGGEMRARVTLKTSSTAEHVVTFVNRVGLDQA